MVRIGGQSALSLNVRNENDAYGTDGNSRKPIVSQTMQHSSTTLNSGKKLRNRNEEAEEPWAEIARFNNLLEMKIKLDEASELKRKHNMQKAYLDQQVQMKANLEIEKEREKQSQRQRMQNLME